MSAAFEEMAAFAREAIRDALSLPWGDNAGALYVMRSDPPLLKLDATGRLTAMTAWHHGSYQIDPDALAEHLSRAERDFAAFEGLSALAAELVMRGEELPPELAVFAAGVLRRELIAPKQPGGRRRKEVRPSFDPALAAGAAAAVERQWPGLPLKLKRGDPVDRSDRKAWNAAVRGTVAGVVAEAMRLEGRRDATTYDGVVKAVERSRKDLQAKFPSNLAR